MAGHSLTIIERRVADSHDDVDRHTMLDQLQETLVLNQGFKGGVSNLAFVASASAGLPQGTIQTWI